MMGACVIPVGGSLPALSTPAGAEHIKISKEAYDDNGVKLIGTRYFWLEDYAKRVTGLFWGAALPATIVFNAPGATVAASTFRFATGLSSANVTISNSATDIKELFYDCAGLTSVTLGFTTALVETINYMFMSCSNLVTINGTISMNACTSAISPFGNCSKLVTVTFAPNTIKISLSLSNSPLLSAASLVSIANGLLEDAAAKTLTMHATSKTAMNALMGDITGADGAYVFTANAGGATSLTTFITNYKVWTIA